LTKDGTGFLSIAAGLPDDGHTQSGQTRFRRCGGMIGQVGRMNRTIREATVKRYHYDSRQPLESHLHDFMQAYNFARRLKTLNGLTPYEYLCKIWTREPARFIMNPNHQMPGLNKGGRLGRRHGKGRKEARLVMARKALAEGLPLETEMAAGGEPGFLLAGRAGA
jgi:hypothetical protein